MKIIVSGGRSFKDKNFIFYCLNKINEKKNITHIIVGDAKGVDQYTKDWALQNNIKFDIYKADWINNKKAAGPIRNKEMIVNNLDADLFIAFPGGVGTNNAVSIATKNKLKIIDLRNEGNKTNEQ